MKKIDSKDSKCPKKRRIHALVNRLQTILNQCLRRLVWVGAKAPGVATSPLLRELGITPIEAMTAAARNRAFLKAPTLNACISDLVRQPRRMQPNAWTFGTMWWLDRFARASAELAQNVRVPPAWRSLQPRVASNLVKAAVSGRFDSVSGHHHRHVLIRGIYFPILHMLGTHCHNTARAFPRGPLHGCTL
jgi:hypothetical protein